MSPIIQVQPCLIDEEIASSKLAYGSFSVQAVRLAEFRSSHYNLVIEYTEVQYTEVRRKSRVKPRSNNLHALSVLVKLTFKLAGNAAYISSSTAHCSYYSFYSL